MSELPPLPNVFAIEPGLGGMDPEVWSRLGYESGKNLHLWKTSEHVVDFVAEGGFRRASEDLAISLHKWMSETPSPQVLICASRGGRLLSRLLAQGQAVPPCLVINAMLYYLFVPEELFDTLHFNMAPEAQDVLFKGVAEYTSPIPASIAPRTVLAASPRDVWGKWRFLPDELLLAEAQRLHDVHVYYNPKDTHGFRSLVGNHENLGALLRLAAHGNPDALPATRSVGHVDSCLQKGAEFCGLLSAATSQDIVWIVVGGKDKGGIVVRSGESLSSESLTKLGTGARIKQLELKGERLHYQKLEGEGPESGWVSIRVKGNPLLVREDEK